MNPPLINLVRSDGSIPFTGAVSIVSDSLTLGDGVHTCYINLDTNNDIVFEYAENNNYAPKTGTLTLKQAGVSTIYYGSGYAPLLNVLSRQTWDYGQPVAIQAWASSAVEAGELYGFWGGVRDDGNRNGVGGGDAVGVFCYNSFWGYGARTWNSITGGVFTSEINNGITLTTGAVGGTFQGCTTGLPTLPSCMGIHVMDSSCSATNNYGLYIDAITAGATDYAIYTNAGTVRLGGNVDARGGAIFNEAGTGTVDFRVESDTEANMFFIDANANTNGLIYLGGTTNGITIDKGGDQKFIGTSGFYPRLLTQSLEPASGTGATELDTSELCIWKDSDDAKCYLCFNDGGTVKTVALT